MMKATKRFLLTDLLYLKLWVALALGIVFAEYINDFYLVLFSPFITFLCLQLIHWMLKIKRSKWQDNLVFSVVVLTGVALHYFAITQSKKAIQSFGAILQQSATHFVRIDNKPIQKPNSVQVEGRLLQTNIEGKRYSYNQKIILYFPSSERAKNYSYGTILQLEGKLSQPIQPHYDFEFNYKRWLERKKIYATLYAKEAIVVAKEENWLYLLRCLPYRARDYFENEIDKYVKEPAANDIAKSILIGIKTDIDRPLYQAYSDTGAIHILSISGLHFGILIIFLDWILKQFIRDEKKRFYIKHGISFCYALITGFNAPIFRSFLMFLFLDIAKISRIKTSSFNILFLSAFIILLFDTQQLFDLGYQFSYAALLGIMLLFNKILWKVEWENRFTTALWKASITLFAAWLFTAPLSLYYFHKLSLLGSLSNYIVVPLCTVIMNIGFIFLAFSKVPFVGDILGGALSLLVSLQNYLIIAFSKISYAQISGVYSNGYILIMAILSILFFNFFLRLKDRASLRLWLTTTLILIFFSSFFPYCIRKKDGEYLMANYKHTAILYATNRTLYVFADTFDDKMKEYFIANLQTQRCVQNIRYYPLQASISGIKQNYSANLNTPSSYFVLCRENKSLWKKALQRCDSFVLMPNLGYKKQELIAELDQNKKYHYAY